MSKRLIIIINILIIAVFAAPLISKQHKDKPMKMRGKACYIDDMDTDNDGKVSKEEWSNFHNKRFDDIDKNKDGYIDKTEKGKHFKNLKRRHHRGMK